MLATQALRYYQVLLPAKQMVGYLEEIIDIIGSDEETQEAYGDLTGQFAGYQTDTASFFSFLFSLIFLPRPIDAPFLRDLIDALDELDPKMRALILTDFEEDSADSRLLIDRVWLAEENLENPDWTRCLQVFDKVIERTLAWGYPLYRCGISKG